MSSIENKTSLCITKKIARIEKIYAINTGYILSILRSGQKLNLLDGINGIFRIIPEFNTNFPFIDRDAERTLHPSSEIEQNLIYPESGINPVDPVIRSNINFIGRDLIDASPLQRRCRKFVASLSQVQSALFIA
jgi:hypothetical protein